jgi:hypothetical protein
VEGCPAEFSATNNPLPTPVTAVPTENGFVGEIVEALVKLIPSLDLETTI